MGLAKWWRIDFHTHTPASKCFKNSKAINTYDENKKIEEAKKWLLKAKENKLDAVVITDHNSVAWIDRIRKAKDELKIEYKNEKFPIIFPGVELSVDTNKYIYWLFLVLIYHNQTLIRLCQYVIYLKMILEIQINI